jgi:hypothetical protein
MSFAEVNGAYADLRGAVCAYEPNSMREIVIRPPVGDNDEASFLRLVGWAYVLFYEAARVTLLYILRLPLGGATSREALHTRDVVAELRTWLVHNLGFERDHDLAIRQRASQWCNECCGSNTPTNLLDLIEHCKALFSQVSASAEDREAFLLGLRSRLERTFEAHQFDAIITETAAILGETVNAKAFREPRMVSWQTFMSSLPKDADVYSEITRRIESELLAHVQSRLPVSGKDLIEELGIAPGPALRRALEQARLLFEAGTRDRTQLLERLRQAVGTA